MGIGNDTYFVDRSDFSIDEQPDGGFDTVLASVDYTLPANVEAIKLVGNATTATGNALNNYLYSNSDKNFSTLIGGDGDDTYFVSYPGARVVEQQGKAHGNDVIYSSYEFDLFNTFVETLVLTGSALSAKGNAQDNTLIGNDSFNFLDGRTGADMMIGGKGDDSYRVDNVGDKIIEKQGKAEGHDFVASSVNYDLAGTFVEHLFLSTGGTHGYGNSQDNTLSSALGDNYLTGRGGNDIFSFAGDWGHDVITDFDVDSDRLAFDYDVYDNFPAFMKDAEQVGDDVFVDFSGYFGTILLQNVQLSSLTESNFIFT